MKKSDIVEAIAADEGSTFVIGEQVLIRTVTFYVTGRITRISTTGITTFLHLEDAAWISDTGRFMDAIETGTLGEIEPVTTPVRVNIATAIDVYHWNHPLPKKQK